MIENVIEFFKNLPAKICTSCGKKLTNNMNATVTNATMQHPVIFLHTLYYYTLNIFN